MRDLNAALLMKLGWRMLTEPESIWARVLRFKYCQGRHLLHPPNRTPMGMVSIGWKGMLENLNPLQRGVGMAVGDDRATAFWLDRCAEPSPLLIFMIRHVPVEKMERRVWDYRCASQGWKCDELSVYVPPPILHRIASFELMEEGVGNNYFWIGEKEGLFLLNPLSASFSKNLHPVKAAGDGFGRLRPRSASCKRAGKSKFLIAIGKPIK
ncbi:hypothetical protein Cgig2_023906 [Carnegiea gigantea]|uniref:Uncharacterized protein n=1 Tax=Carnegiea gigantea TaxID=171969 RepID=A0A9Q1JJC4_9CARY|nr:hypothetical protein Cgig2_023906 [Carnegiea gigantea]